jgi:hypothetical protein
MWSCLFLTTGVWLLVVFYFLHLIIALAIIFQPQLQLCGELIQHYRAQRRAAQEYVELEEGGREVFMTPI